MDNSHPMNNGMYISLGRPMSEACIVRGRCVQYLEFDIMQGKTYFNEYDLKGVCTSAPCCNMKLVI